MAETASAEGRYDYVIVGGGTAGCVLANRLSADPATRVLLLEAGGRDNYHWIHIPVGYLYCMGNPRTDWMMRTEPEPGLNGRSLGYPRGKVLGGCSAINGMIYMRGQAADYDHWRQLGNAGWGWDDVLPYFRRSEGSFRGETELHGGGGEWKVARQRLRWDILEAFRDAAEEIGIPRRDDFNDGDNEGSGFFEVNQQNGIRWTTAKGFLRPVRDRANLHIVTGALVTGLTLAGRRASGVRYRLGTDERTASRRRRGDPRRRRDQLAEAPRTLRDRRPGRARRARHPGQARAPRRRRQPAGPPADPHRLPRQRRADAEPARQQPAGQGADGGRIRALPPRAAVHGAEPARHLHPQRRDGGDRPISNTTSSRSRPTSSATRCTPTRR